MLAALTLSLSACDYWYNTVPSPDQLWYYIPWFDQMIYMRSIRPYSSNNVPRYTVKGTVPIGGGEARKPVLGRSVPFETDLLKERISARQIAIDYPAGYSPIIPLC